MVPNHRTGAISQSPSLLLKSPADIHIISSNAELRIESAYGFQRRFAESHIAAGDMFRLAIGQENVNRIAWRVSDALCYETITRRGDIGTAHTRVLHVHKCAREISQPVRIRVRIVID